MNGENELSNSYRLTGSETTGSSSRLQENFSITVDEFIEYTASPIQKVEPNDVNL